MKTRLTIVSGHPTLRRIASRTRVGRVEEGRHEEPGAARAHLVHVPDDAGQPLAEDYGPSDPGFLKVEHQPVPVVVVPGALLVELERAGPLIGRAQGLAIPPDYEVVPIAIVDRMHEQHRAR